MRTRLARGAARRLRNLAEALEREAAAPVEPVAPTAPADPDKPLHTLYPYEAPTEPAQRLAPAFFEPVTIERTDAIPPSTPGSMLSLWPQVPQAHKWTHYFAGYEAAAAHLRDRPIRMLEIGVYQGGSAELWTRYLHPDSVYVAIDVNPACAIHDAPKQNRHIRIGNQIDEAFLADLTAEFGPFDFILDDGSHQVLHQVRSFSHLFLDALTSPGTYLVEDTHSNFWQDYRDQPYSFIDLCKDLVDVMHDHYVQFPDESFFRRHGQDQVASAQVPRIAAELEEIRFLDSMVLLRKRTRDHLPLSVHRASEHGQP